MLDPDSNSEPQETLAKPASIPAARKWQPGEVIEGLYEVVAGPFDGSMGRVYRVRHCNWNIELAMKCPRPDLWAHEVLLRRFEREVDAWVETGRHLNIVNAYYTRRIESIPYLFMDYMDGGSLGQWMKGKNWNTHPAEILSYAIGIASGMAKIHSLGLIHRDLKPENCLLNSYGGIGVSDLGTVKFLGLDGAEGEVQDEVFKGSVWGEMTCGGRLMGTPAYAAPEQFEGKADAASDRYSYSVMLYELVCGQRPFLMPRELYHPDRRVFAARLFEYFKKAHQEMEPEEPGAKISGLDEGLNALIMEGLAKQNREASFEVVKQKLKQLYEGVTGSSYVEPEIEEAELIADDWNNRALTYLDLGKESKEVEQCWERALQIDKAHIATTFNYGYYQWHNKQFDPYAYLKSVQGLEGTHGGSAEYWYYLAQVAGEMGFITTAKESAQKAKELGYDEAAVAALKITDPCLRVFEGHTGWVTSVAITPDGRYAISGSYTLRLWDIGTGNCLRMFEGHKNYVSSIANTPDVRYVLSKGGTLKLWDINTGACVRVFEGLWGKSSVAITPDGRYALSGSGDKTLRLWDIETGACVRVLEGHTNGVTSVAITSDGRYALSGSGDKTLRLWYIETGACVRVLEGHINGVTSVAITSDGRYALSGSGDKTLRLWYIETGACVRVLEGHINGVTSVAITSDGRYAVSGSGDKTLRLWDIETGACVKVLEGHTNGVTSVAITSDERYALSGSMDKTLRLWNIKERNKNYFDYIISQPECLKIILDKINQKKYVIKKSNTLIADRKYKEVYIILRELIQTPQFERDSQMLELLHFCGLKIGRRKNPISCWSVKILNGHTYNICQVAITPDGRYALSGSGDKTLRLWDIETGACVRVLEGHTNGVTSVAITSDGRYAVSGSGDKTLRLWDIETGACVKVLEGHTNGVTSVAITPDGHYALSGSGDKTLRLWDMDTGACDSVVEEHSLIASVAITPDAKYALSGSYDKTLSLWDIETGICIRLFTEYSWIISVVITPDGRNALSGGNDGTLRLWDIETGACVRALEGHTYGVTSVAITPDGHYALSGSGDRTLRLWDIGSGSCIRVFEGHTEGVTSIAITPDGKYAVSGSRDNTIRLWEFQWDWEFPEPADWDEGARPYLEIFLTLHPNWTEDDFQQLLTDLQLRGYGWLRSEGVHKELEKMSSNK